MAPTPSQRPPEKNGNLKYAAIGLLFLAGAAGLWLFAAPEPTPEPVAAPTPPPAAERVNPMAEPELELEPEPEVPDAGPEPAPEPKRKVRKRKAGASPAPGGWDCEGDLDRGAAAKVIGSNRAQVRSCYERGLKLNNLLQGSIRLKLKVGAGGKVTNAKVSGSLRDNDVFACVRKLAEGWRFAEPSGGKCAVMEVPYSFSPKH
ncbi:MAG: AgmX/PglI C-terminal domain-containing protein [Myxococcales bacterium]|nr:AgmX/PglI C-terminal domain-containing protein [Myxococcales bacterium]